VAGSRSAEVGLRMKVLLPYLIGAAFTFVVQDLVQVYVVPRVQTRRQREDRWVKDVRDLGELLFPLKL
jgi:large-conductance mechanosensitive channel